MSKSNAKSKRGGKRPGAGRKKVTDKVLPLTIYVKDSVIKANGGAKKAKAKSISALTGVDNF